ncbi:hypothetical protein X798_07515, partial [Onchocerca flexuosa]
VFKYAPVTPKYAKYAKIRQIRQNKPLYKSHVKMAALTARFAGMAEQTVLSIFLYANYHVTTKIITLHTSPSPYLSRTMPNYPADLTSKQQKAPTSKTSHIAAKKASKKKSETDPTITENENPKSNPTS